MSAPNGVTSLAVPSTPLTPDQYKQYALQDPGFIGLQSALKGNEDAYRAAIRGGINSGVVSLGAVPTDSSVGGYLDDGTAAAATANPLSTTAQFNTQHHNNFRDISNQMAARGAYDSGDLTYALGNEAARDTTARADAMSKFLTYANGLFGQLGSMQAGDAAQLGTELGNAAMRQLALHPGSTVSAVWDDSRGAYVDSQGNLYDQYGNHVTSVGGPPTTNFAPINSGAPAAGGNNVGGLFGSTPTVINFADLVNANAANTGANYSALPNAPYTPPDQPIITRGAGPRLS